MNAIDEAIERLDQVDFGLFEEHLRRCQNSGGVVVLSRRLVFLGAAWDPVGGDDERTLAVMYVHGDAAGEILPVVEMARRNGFTHVVWCREICRHDSTLRKVTLERFERICRKCYGQGLV